MGPTVSDVLLNRKRLFDMCVAGISAMNATADQLLCFNFKCLTLGGAAEPDELEALAALLAETRECLGLIRQKTTELLDQGGLVPPFDLMLDRLNYLHLLVEGLVHRCALPDSAGSLKGGCEERDEQVA